MKALPLTALALAGLLATGLALAQEAAIRKNLAERLPNFPKIDEVSKTPIPGIYEIRLGTELLYTDEQGSYILQGSLIDTRTRANLTEERIEKLTAIDFSKLPIKDAVVIKQGTGARKLAVFVDPNCGYCKRFERDLATVKDVTIYTFLYPILGPDSTVKSKDIWCAKDAAKSWRGWMVDNVAPVKTMGSCDTSAIDRNVAMGQKYRVQGTPALVFENGVRKPGALPAAQVEALLVAAEKKS
ncbi:MAG: DsbC family protein [Rubrivivax sp.]|nr:DsbC family protein [Rubrivivax sp.]